MVVPFCRASLACTAVAMVVLFGSGFANEVEECESPLEQEHSSSQQSACLLQRSRSEVTSERPQVNPQLVQRKSKDQKGSKDQPALKQKQSSKSHSPQSFKDLSWTTNIGQMHHECAGSRFEVDFTGTRSGMAVNSGMLLSKGTCSDSINTTMPSLTQALTCEKTGTGCHMWCAPVWQSHYDTTDWSAFDSRCKNWDGGFNDNDTQCANTGKVFTWARTEVPSSKNALEMTLAIATNCSTWCAPLWITIYDTKNWAKSYRWCFNRKDDWGACDNAEDVSLYAWHDRKFEFHHFMHKHGYTADTFALEFATYSEFEAAEVLMNSVQLTHVKDTTPAPLPDHQACGSTRQCSSKHQCCRKGDSEVDAKCCPTTWSCCEDSCCPSYYTCSITAFGHTCKPPTDEVATKPDLCHL